MAPPAAAAKRPRNILRALGDMLGESIANYKLTWDLHLLLLLRRGKPAGKALPDLHTAPHHRRPAAAAGGTTSFYSALSCRYIDPDTAFYSPQAVEFSCSSTPSCSSSHSSRRKSHRRRRGRREDYYYLDGDAARVATAFEYFDSRDIVADTESSLSSPSPSPARVVRQLRVTDSPFPEREEGEEVDGFVDRAAEEFIRRFYEQLRLQQ